MSTKFERMDEPYMHGYAATRADGIQVEAVRCYENQWSVFLTRDGSVVARSIAEYKACRDGYLSKADAMQIAKQLI